MIKNKESELVEVIQKKIDNIILNVRKVDNDGRVYFQEVPMSEYTTKNKAFVDIMKINDKTPTQYINSTNTYSNEFQQMYFMLVEIIVKETLAILIRDTEVSSLARLNKLEQHFDALVNALVGVPETAGTILSYKASNPKYDRDVLRDEENQQGTDLK